MNCGAIIKPPLYACCYVKLWISSLTRALVLCAEAELIYNVLASDAQHGDSTLCMCIHTHTYVLCLVASFQLSSVTQSCPTLRPHGPQHTRPPCPSPTPGVYSRLMSIESVMPSNHLILCRPLLLLPSIFPSIRVFSNESVLHIRWPQYWSFSFNISPSNEYSGLISFRMDWLDLLAVQGTLKSLLQHHRSKASILWCLWSNSNIHT